MSVWKIIETKQGLASVIPNKNFFFLFDIVFDKDLFLSLWITIKLMTKRKKVEWESRKSRISWRACKEWQ